MHKGDILVKLDSKDLQKEMNGLIADMNKAQTQTIYLEIQAPEGELDPVRHRPPSTPGPDLRGEDHGQELQGADRDRRRAD